MMKLEEDTLLDYNYSWEIINISIVMLHIEKIRSQG